MGISLPKNKKYELLALSVFFIIAEVLIFVMTSEWINRFIGSAMAVFMTFLLGIVFHYGFKETLQTMKEHKKIVLLFLVCLLLVCFMVFSIKRDIALTSVLGKLVLLVQCFMFPVVVLGLLGIYVWKFEHWKLYLLLILFFGLAMMLIIPIGGVPDEVNHLNTAYRISNVFLGIKDNADGVMMRADDSSLAMQLYGRNQYYDAAGYSVYLSNLLNPLKDGSIVWTNVTYVHDLPFPYIMPALGITLGRLIGLGTYQALMIGRLFNFAMYVLISTYAVKIIPFAKLPLMILFLLPMSIQQGMSFSYDVYVNSLTMLLVAFSVLIIDTKDEKVLSKKEFIIMLLASVFLFPMKSKAYFLIAFMPWIVLLFKKHPLTQKTKKIVKKTLLILLAVFVVGYVVWGLTGAASYPYTVGELNYGGTAATTVPGYSISYFIAHPFEIFGVLYRTAQTLWEFYAVTFIGEQLGWLDLGIPRIFTVIIYILLLFATMKPSDDSRVLTKNQKWFFGGFGLLTLGFTFAGMLLYWSEIANGYITGVQGRYFIPVALCVVLVLRSNMFQRSKETDAMISAGMLMAVVGVLEIILVHF